jgi:polyisoprenoid-binding protein YceI
VSVMVRAASTVLALTLAACGGPATQPAPTSTDQPTVGTATVKPAGNPSAAGPWTFTVDASSKTTVRVREVLAQVRAPGDAVLTATGMKGSFTLNTDGSFAPSSRITTDLTTLASDQRQRDQFIKDNTLETRRFASAEFVPTKANGLTLPLPVSGDVTFTLEGKMTIHGTTKDVTFDVKATRTGTKLSATATAKPDWKFADFGMTVPRVVSVLSIEDDIRVEIELLATEGG